MQPDDYIDLDQKQDDNERHAAKTWHSNSPHIRTILSYYVYIIACSLHIVKQAASKAPRTE
jgi:hypothetical protein